MSVIASLLKERITIEQPVTVDDGYGGKETSWTTLATVFAQVEPVRQSTRERALGEQVLAIAGYRVRIRLRSDVDATMRLGWKGHVLQIHSLHEQDGLLELLTYEEQV